MVGYIIIAAVIILLLAIPVIRSINRKSRSSKAYNEVIDQTIKKDINGNEYEKICTYSDGRIEIKFSFYDSKNRLIKIVGDLGNGHKYTQSYMYDEFGNQQRGLFTTLAPEADIYEVYERILSRMNAEKDSK